MMTIYTNLNDIFEFIISTLENEISVRIIMLPMDLSHILNAFIVVSSANSGSWYHSRA